MNYNAWEVWTALVKFEDSPEAKIRPVLILEDKIVCVVCLKMTSKLPRAGEYQLREWAAVGLNKPTTVRIGKILKLKDKDLKRKVGDLHPIDIANIQAMLL